MSQWLWFKLMKYFISYCLRTNPDMGGGPSGVEDAGGGAPALHAPVVATGGGGVPYDPIMGGGGSPLGPAAEKPLTGGGAMPGPAMCEGGGATGDASREPGGDAIGGGGSRCLWAPSPGLMGASPSSAYVSFRIIRIVSSDSLQREAHT